MAVCGLSLYQGSLKAAKLQDKNLFFKSSLLILMVSTNAFHSTNLFCCFHITWHQPIAQLHLSVYKPHTTHNSSIYSDEGLTLETSASESLYSGQFTLSAQQIKPNYLVILPTNAVPQFPQKLTPFRIKCSTARFEQPSSLPQQFH